MITNFLFVFQNSLRNQGHWESGEHTHAADSPAASHRGSAPILAFLSLGALISYCWFSSGVLVYLKYMPNTKAVTLQ